MAAFTVCTNDAFLAGGHVVVRADKSNGIVRAKMTRSMEDASARIAGPAEPPGAAAVRGSEITRSGIGGGSAPESTPQAKDPAPLAWQTEGRGLDGLSISPRKSNHHVPRSRAYPLNWPPFVREDQRQPLGPSAKHVLLARPSCTSFKAQPRGPVTLRQISLDCVSLARSRAYFGGEKTQSTGFRRIIYAVEANSALPLRSRAKSGARPTAQTVEPNPAHVRRRTADGHVAEANPARHCRGANSHSTPERERQPPKKYAFRRHRQRLVRTNIGT